jgi:squalene-associated FAD-dependent desaturase
MTGARLAADVVVIGAGFAGLSAAVRLTLAGRRVVVIEESPRLGGRATSFVDRETGERVDNGQHVLFGCYRETYAFLRSVGAADLAPLQSRLRLRMADARGRQAELVCPPLPAPWHLLAGVLRWPAIGLADRLRVLRLARVLREVRRRGAAEAAARVPADQTVSTWLASQGQSPVLCDWLWRPLAIAALNQSPDTAAARPFVRVLGELFAADQDAAAIGLPVVPLDDLFAAPAKELIEREGGAVVLKTPARIVLAADGSVAHVRAAASIVEARTVISAVPWHAFGRIWEEGVPARLAAIAADAAATEPSPIVTANLWLDGPVMTGRFIGLVGGPMHWVFDKSAIFGTQAGHLSVVASGAAELAAMENAEIARLAAEQLRGALPDMKSRKILRSVVVREHRATFSLAPGGPARPAAITPLDGFYLAGDWTDTGLPATIEGAVASGHRAAEEICG